MRANATVLRESRRPTGLCLARQTGWHPERDSGSRHHFIQRVQVGDMLLEFSTFEDRDGFFYSCEPSKFATCPFVIVVELEVLTVELASNI